MGAILAADESTALDVKPAPRQIAQNLDNGCRFMNYEVGRRADGDLRILANYASRACGHHVELLAERLGSAITAHGPWV